MAKFDDFQAHNISMDLTKMVISNGLINPHSDGKKLADEILDFYQTVQNYFAKESE